MLQNIRKSRGGFTLVEIMIVVAIIALLAAIAVPGFLRSRKRSQATAILNDASGSSPTLFDILGNTYSVNTFDSGVKVSTTTETSFQDVIDNGSSFWGAYY